jgi:hypothetical protein
MNRRSWLRSEYGSPVPRDLKSRGTGTNLPGAVPESNAADRRAHKTQQDIRPRWGRLITTSPEQ